MTVSLVFGFPHPVDEVSARLVAGGVVVMTIAELATHNRLLLAVLAYGFVARLLTGPTLSPLGRLVTQVVRPRLDITPRPVPGPPKRFAQGVGVLFTASALVLALVGAWTAVTALLTVLLVFATLEATVGFCMGCVVFRALMRAGVIPAHVCAECNDIWNREPVTPSSP